jgi:hypothetical protein
MTTTIGTALIEYDSTYNSIHWIVSTLPLSGDNMTTVKIGRSTFSGTNDFFLE